MTRLFRPLNGVELRQILINECTQRLEKCQLLVEHLTFGKVNYKVEITIDSYPMDSPAVVGATRTLGNPDHIGPSDREELVFTGEIGETQETAPDKIRENHQLPTLRTERSPDTGLMADVEQRFITETVGQGTKPRKTNTKSVKSVTSPTPMEVKAQPAEIKAEPLLDDDGNPVGVVSG